MLNLQVPVPSQPFGLISFVSPNDVSPLVGLEIPWRNQNDVSQPYRARGGLILGVVIGVLKLPERRYMERRIPISPFQLPNFEDKLYLDDAVKITEEIVKVMRPDRETRLKVCSGYVLSSTRRHLRERRFNVEEVEITGELQEMVERSYV